MFFFQCSILRQNRCPKETIFPYKCPKKFDFRQETKAFEPREATNLGSTRFVHAAHGSQKRFDDPIWSHWAACWCFPPNVAPSFLVRKKVFWLCMLTFLRHIQIHSEMIPLQQMWNRGTEQFLKYNLSYITCCMPFWQLPSSEIGKLYPHNSVAPPRSQPFEHESQESMANQINGAKIEVKPGFSLKEWGLG